jgi:hypothetical protein
MSVPNHFSVVQQVFAAGSWRLDTREGCGEFTEAVVSALHAVDPNWGHFRKRPGQEQWNGHAVDAACYRLGSGVDFIASSQSPTARINWLVYPDAPPSPDWYAPETSPVVVIPPVDKPPDALPPDLAVAFQLAKLSARLELVVSMVEQIAIVQARGVGGYGIVLTPPQPKE